MSSHQNYRRGHARVLERGPRWERPNPAKGCNATHVARARLWWRTALRKAVRRAERRRIAALAVGACPRCGCAFEECECEDRDQEQRPTAAATEEGQ